MNYAKLETSDRLKRVDRLLSQGGEFSTMDIVTGAQVMAVSAAISELRSQGRRINCQRRGNYWYYRKLRK